MASIYTQRGEANYHEEWRPFYQEILTTACTLGECKIGEEKSEFIEMVLAKTRYE